MTTAELPSSSATNRVWWRSWHWLHLIYIVFPLFQVFLGNDNSVFAWALCWFVIVATVVMYALVMWRPERSRWWATVPMAALGVLATPFNAGAGMLFVYAAASAGLHESRRDAQRWFVGLTIAAGVLCLVSFVPMPWRLWGLIPPLIFIWVIGLALLEQTERERRGADLRVRNAHIEQLATVAERERIARDLHDLLGHSLTAVVMRAQLVGELVRSDPERAQAEAAVIEQTAREALSEVRRTVTGWRQGSLEAELEAAQRTLGSIGVELTVRRAPDLHLVGPTEHELALAVRETMTNVVRHARAHTCVVAIDAQEGELRVVVADDGVGGSAPEGNGLTGLRERITALGGRVQRTGSAGTTVTIAVPLQVAV